MLCLATLCDYRNGGKGGKDHYTRSVYHQVRTHQREKQTHSLFLSIEISGIYCDNVHNIIIIKTTLIIITSHMTSHISQVIQIHAYQDVLMGSFLLQGRNQLVGVTIVYGGYYVSLILDTMLV